MYREVRLNPPHPLTRPWAQRGLAALFLLAAAAYLLSSLCAIINFAWLQPLYDQFRLYDFYLSLPFPDNALQLENGHRPVIPALLRLAEIEWMQADQTLQIAVGAGLAFATSLSLAWYAWRAAALNLAARAAGVLVAVLGVLWLANARMLLHGNELVHAYLVTFCLVASAACAWQAAQRNALAWITLASLCCVVATFSFGTGMAAFPALIVLAWLLRLPWRALAVPVLMLALCLGIYLYGLPGDDGVRGQLALRPVEVMATGARWLSSPWIVGWLGLGDAELYGWAQDFLRNSPLPGSLVVVAETLQNWTGLRWTAGGATLVGAAGVLTFAALLLPRLWRRAPLDRLEAVAIGLCLGTLGIALLISLGRLDYLKMYPMQVFADRYLLWPCLFWTGLVLLVLRTAMRLGPAARTAVLLPLLLLPVIALPTHSLWLGWGATVYRNLQQSAASARADAYDVRHFGDNGAVSAEVTLRVLDRLRERQLAMFAATGTAWLGKTYTGTLQPPSGIQALPLGVEALRDQRDGSPIARFDGWIGSGIRAAQRGGALVVLDEASRIVGFAEYSFIGPGVSPLRLSLPRKRGFDGYIREYDAKAGYRLALLQGLNEDGLLLYEIQQPAAIVDN